MKTKTNGIASKSAVYLPHEVIEEILSRLPVKPLLRFRCVSKTCRNLIGTERFIETHHQNLTRNPSLQHHRLISCYQGPVQLSLASLLTESTAGIDPTRLPVPPSFGSTWEQSSMLGCHVGVVCIMDRPGRFHLWNPATRARREVEALPEQFDVVVRRREVWMTGFGWDEASGAYKVFVTLWNCFEKRCRIYSSKTDSWKVIEYRDYGFLPHGVGHFASGGLHWHCRSQVYEEGMDCILRVDLRKDEFERVEMPCDTAGSWWSWLGVVGGCLAVAFKYKEPEEGVDVWVREEESWVKRVRVPNVDVGIRFTRGWCLPLWMGEDGEVLMICSNSFLVYYPRRDLRLPLKEIVGPRISYVYVESLVSF